VIKVNSVFWVVPHISIYEVWPIRRSPNPKTVLKVNSVLRIVPQISIYDVHRVHFGWLYDRQIPKLYSTLTRFLESYLRYRYMTFGRLADRQIPKLNSKLTRFFESHLRYRYMTFGRSPSIRTILFRAARFDRAMPIAGTADNPPKTRARLIIYLMLSAVPVCTQRRMRVRSAAASQRIWSGWNAAASRADWRSVGDSKRAGRLNKGYYWSYLLGASVRKTYQNLDKAINSFLT